MHSTVLLPVDQALQTDEIAAEYALDLVADTGVLHVLHVIHPGIAEARSDEPRVIDEMKAFFSDRDVAPDITYTVVEGTPAEEITAAAGDRATDVIVMTTHARTGFTRLVTGSVTETVVRTAPCPVYSISPNAIPDA